ncbi:MAG: HAMP domain-containing sensor histidine kinase [Bacteroides sp.]
MWFNQRLYFLILAYVLLILLTAGAAGWLLWSHTGIIIGTMLMGCALLQIAALVHRLNSFNRKIRLFFDAVEDRENMCYFPETGRGDEQQQLHRSLNRINELLAQSKADQQKQDRFYRSLLEEVPIGVLAWNATGQIVIANQAAHSLLGDAALVNRRGVESFLEQHNNLSVSRSEMKLQAEVITLLSVKDIANELTDRESESWSKLTHVLTHEIMNTIAPIISLSQTLSTYTDVDQKVHRGLDIIRTQGERLMEFTESFRHLSYLPPPDKRLFSLSGLLQNLYELLQGDMQVRAISFSIRSAPSSISFLGDENQFSQVLLNLLKNAMQALEGQTQGSIRVCLQQTTDRILIEIANNGPVILPEMQEKIFVPFFTTKAEGSGIGLSLCRQILRLHKGHLFVKESSSEQTVFCIELPLEEHDSEESTNAS